MRISDWSSDVCSSDLRWFNPNPTLLGATAEDRERFYALSRYPEEREEGEIELASGTDFAQRLFFGQPRSDVPNGLWFRSEEHTSELQSLMRISYAVFCLKKKKKQQTTNSKQHTIEQQ